MIDFIEAIKYGCKDSPNLTHCKPFQCKLNKFGWNTYGLKGCDEIQVHYKPESGGLRIKGSLPYFIQGHNFSFSREGFVECVEVLQNLLGVGLWDAEVAEFEYGTIFPVEVQPSLLIRNHYAPSGSHLVQDEKGKDKGSFRWWTDSDKVLKMYDAGKNVKQKLRPKERDVLAGCGYNPDKNYIKFEVHYKKPERITGRVITLEDLQSTEFVKILNNDIVRKYQELRPMRTLKPQTDKKKLSALDIVVSAFVEEEMNQGVPMEGVKRKVYRYANSAGCLTTPDKDARKATIRRAFGRLAESESSSWDLTEMLQRSLDADAGQGKDQMREDLK